MIAISTAFSEAIIAIDINGTRDFCMLDANCQQSENVLLKIDALLDKNGLSIKDNDAFGLVVGPGSFTGLRIGASLVKGLCAGSQNKCKVVGISSLQLLAREFVKNQPQKDFLCVLNALGGLVFVCRFSKDGEKKGEEQLLPREKFSSLRLTKVGLKGENLAKNQVVLTPQTLLEEANRLLEEDNLIDAATFSPTYIRKSQAEVTLEEKENALKKAEKLEKYQKVKKV